MVYKYRTIINYSGKTFLMSVCSHCTLVHPSLNFVPTCRVCTPVQLNEHKHSFSSILSPDILIENMSNNFEDKIDKVDKMLSNWSYRYLTPFGKVTVVKSLGLSKLSHVALVIPNPTKVGNYIL